MALKVVVTKAGSSDVLSEHSFGKEARARGIVIGSDEGNDIVTPGAAPRHGRIERQSKGYFFVDLDSDVGFKSDDVAIESGGKAIVTEGTRLLVGDCQIEFMRGETPRRKPAAVVEEAGEIESASRSILSDVSSHFLGEGSFADKEEVERFGELLKLSLEIAMEWMGRALRGREEFKDQFSAPLTEIYARSLNPVKSKGQDISQIANYLLDWREDRDLDEIRGALQHAFQDMAKHQMGLLAGVQQFVGELQAKLDPRRIEQDAGGGFLGGAKKAWERYSELYGETFTESSRLFNELIYPSIRKGYIFSHEDIASDSKTPPEEAE